MRRNIIMLLLVSAFVAAGCNSTGDTQVETVANAGTKSMTGEGPQIAFDRTKTDVDTIKCMEVTNCVFRYTNTGDQPLVISNVITTCGCVKSHHSEEPLMPGQTDSMNFELRINDLGSLTKAVVVKSNAINEPAATHRMFGYVID